MFRYYAIRNNQLFEIHVRYASESCRSDPVSIQISPWFYSKSSNPTVLVDGYSTFFLIGYNAYIPLTEQYINSTNWYCVHPLHPYQHITSGNNICIIRLSTQSLNIMQVVAPNEGKESSTAFEYDISNDSTVFRYVVGTSEKKTVYELNDIKNNITQYICSQMETMYTYPTCTDATQNGLETDVDCGGATSCDRCEIGLKCLVKADCITAICTDYICSSDKAQYITIYIILVIFIIVVVPLVFVLCNMTTSKTHKEVRLKHVIKKESRSSIRIPDPVIPYPSKAIKLDIADIN
ncbi:hypothetical protein WA158_002718 [Blastocystis sp. Blastoise]